MITTTKSINETPNLGQNTRHCHNQQKKTKKNKGTCKIVEFADLANHKIKQKESEKKDKYFDLAQELEKTMEPEGDDYTNRDWSFWYSYQRIIKGAGKLGGWGTRGDHPNRKIIENGQDTEKSSGDLRKFAVTQTPVKDRQLKLMCKTIKE